MSKMNKLKHKPVRQDFQNEPTIMKNIIFLVKWVFFLPSNRQLSGHRAENAFYQNLVDAFIIDILNLEFPCFCIISVPMVGQIFVLVKNDDFYEIRYKSISSSVFSTPILTKPSKLCGLSFIISCLRSNPNVGKWKHACLTALEQGFQKWSNHRNAFITALKLCEKHKILQFCEKLDPQVCT